MVFCVCDSEDEEGIYDFPSELGSLRGPLAGDVASSFNHGNSAVKTPRKEVGTYEHYENESPESRHADRLDAMRMATNEAAAENMKKEMDRERAVVRTKSAYMESHGS